ncbi:tetratricopeptide repeat protein [Pseudooceanicola sp. 200-1SW]|uniref:helix-turn-helix domain-containing protein n=1 Tax=Pseudooceanicola sp. 200-1SW TaxID=3425949 RepID=UPI003D7FB298
MFGELVKARRIALGLTQSDLAARAFGNADRKGDVSRIENGKFKRPTEETISKLGEALGITEELRSAVTQKRQDEATQATSELAIRLQEALKASEKTLELRTEIQHNTQLVKALARRYAEGNPEDFDAALRGLERALEVAAQRSPGGNLDAEVTAIMAEVDRLNDAGRFEEAGEALCRAREARRERIAEEKAALVALLDKGVAQAVLVRSVDEVVSCELEKLEIEVPQPAARFEALLHVWEGWYARGRDKGLNFDLEVAIYLAEASQSLATHPNEHAIARENRGLALQTLGQREPGTYKLEKSISAFHSAIEELPRERSPLEWARKMNNLGAALTALGARESGTARLEEAIAAYQDALQEMTREKVPLDWASTQMNLGNALQTLGQRESGTARLEQAVAAYRNALQEWTRERVPLDWAMTQMNLGTALATLGQRESGTARLEQAVEAYRRALLELTRERAPLGWADAQLHLGSALRALGERATGTDRLQQAVAAFRNALLELTRERVPLDWAMTQMSLGNALRTLGQRESDTARLEEAVAAYRNALQEMTRERVPLDWAMTQMNLGNALQTLGQRESGTARLEQAVAAYRNALQEWTRERVPLDWAMTQENIALAELAFADKTDATAEAHLRAALAHVEAALEVYSPESSAYYHDRATRLRDGILSRL